MIREEVAGLLEFSYTLMSCNACGCSDTSSALIVAIPQQTGVDDNGTAQLPTHYSLETNFPNPFNPSTEMQFSLPIRGRIELAIFNSLGQRVATLIDGEMPAGYHTVTWVAGDQASGVYFYRLTADDFVATRKMLLLK